MTKYKLILLVTFVLLGCSKKIIIQDLHVDAINILNFGAIPNDGKDDSPAIQKSIDFAIKNSKSSLVYCPPGVYDLDKGISVVHPKENGEYNFTTITLRGHIPAYTPNQAIGSTTVFKIHHKGFGLALQLSRNSVIENIVFEGSATYSTDIKNIMEFTADEWGIKANANTNSFSPSCAIVIDPFHVNVPKNEQYKDLSKLYTNQSNSGSSMVLIKGCAFFNHYIAIANNPSNGVQNGDNIRAEQCHVNTCHTFWSAGQTQSRANSIDNIYALFLHTLVSGVQIGNQQGTPPTISNVNLAGFCKIVFDIKTGFSGLNVYRSYFESIWSLGLCDGISTSFDQCQIKFHKPSDEFFMPPFHLYANNVVAFRDCNIEYFDNCNTRMPFLFRSTSLLLSGGSIEGGVVVADGYTNFGGDDLHKVTLDNVNIKCLGKVAGKKNTQKPTSKIKDEIIMGGEVISTTEGDIYVNNGTTYNQLYLEEANIKINIQTKTATFSTSKPSSYKIGDNIFTGQYVEGNTSGFSNSIKLRSPLGYISKIVENEITVSGVPLGFPTGKTSLYLVEYPVLEINSASSRKIKSGINFFKVKRD